MHIFRDPSRVPVVIVEQHVVNVSLHASGKFSFSLPNKKETSTVPTGPEVKPVPTIGQKRNGCILRVVIFEHGFQVSEGKLSARLHDSRAWQSFSSHYLKFIQLLFQRNT